MHEKKLVERRDWLKEEAVLVSWLCWVSVMIHFCMGSMEKSRWA